MLGKMLDEAAKRIQYSIQTLKTKFVFNVDQTSSNIIWQTLDDPKWVDAMLDAFDRGFRS